MELKMSAKRLEEKGYYEVLDGENKGTRVWPPTEADLASDDKKTAWHMSHDHGQTGGGLLYDKAVKEDGGDLFDTGPRGTGRFVLIVPAGDKPAYVKLTKFDDRAERGEVMQKRAGFGTKARS